MLRLSSSTIPCFLSFLVLAASLFSCKKTSSSTNPNPASTTRPVKSIQVTYPSNQSPNSFYNRITCAFTTDTVNNSFNIQILDTAFGGGIYVSFITSKTYYYSSNLPRRVIKISFRQSRQVEYDVPGPNISYDILFDYDDYTDIPDHISVIDYSDLAGTQITDQSTQAVSKFSKDYYYDGTYDYMTWTITPIPAMPLKSLGWGGQRGSYSYDAYTDSTFNVKESDSHYYTTLFNNMPEFTDPNVAFASQYSFTPDKLCKSVVINMVSPDFKTFIGQRKLDFTYEKNTSGLSSIMDLFCAERAIFWEKVAQQNTGLIQMDNWWNYDYLDLYEPDLHSYYADICSSYTDSI